MIQLTSSTIVWTVSMVWWTTSVTRIGPFPVIPSSTVPAVVATPFIVRPVRIPSLQTAISAFRRVLFAWIAWMCAMFAGRWMRPFDFFPLFHRVFLTILFTVQPINVHFHLVFDQLLHDFRVTFAIRVHWFVFYAPPFGVPFAGQSFLVRQFFALRRFFIQITTGKCKFRLFQLDNYLHIVFRWIGRLFRIRYTKIVKS